MPTRICSKRFVINPGNRQFAAEQPQWLNRLQLIGALAFMLSTIFSGPLRWMLASAGLAVAAYLPIIGGLAVAMLTLAYQFAKGAFGARALMLCACLGYSIFVGMLMIPNPAQVAFATYLFIPIYIGLLLAPAWQRIGHWPRMIGVLWACVVVAVVLNPYLAFPWVGFEYSVGSVSVETGREWWSGDVQRYSGVSRASFDAAIQSVILLTVACGHTAKRTWRVVMYSATAYCIWLTNSKTVLVVLAVAVMCTEISPVALRRIRIPTIAVLVAFGWAMPLIGLLYNPRLNALNTSSSLHSYEDRLRNMWPEAFDLWFERGTWLTGRGLGALGTAQTYFEPHLFNAGDNLHLYIFVTLGMLAAPLTLYVCWQVAHLRISKERLGRVPLVLFLVTLTYGLTTNAIENASVALILALVARISADAPAFRERG